MADPLPSFGLDPSIVNYVQGMPSGGPVAQQMAPSPPDMSASYGLPSSVVTGVQNGFAPTMMPQAPIPDAAAPPPALPPSVMAGIQNGFDPNAVPNQPPMISELPSQAGVTAPSTPAPGALPVQNTPDYNAGTVSAPSTLAEVAKANQVYDKKQAANAAFAATPEGIAQKADAQNLAAIDKLRQGNVDADAVQTSQNAAVAAATQASTDRQAKQEQIDAAQRAADQATTAKYSQQYAQQIKDAADYKVNTNRDVGMGGLIAVALSGIGDALDHHHGPNAALQIINDSIDKHIADQWAQKKALGDKATGTKDVLDVSRQDATSHRQDQDVQKAAMLVDANNQIANIKAQSANPALKARAETMQAGIEQQIAGITTGMAQRKLEAQKAAQEETDKRAQLGVSYGQLDLARQEHKDALAQSDRDFTLKVAEAANRVKDTTAAQQKNAEENGLAMPTGIDSSGKPVFEQVTQNDGRTPWAAPKEAAVKLGELQSATIDGVKAIDVLRHKRSEFSTNEQFDNWIMKNEEGRALMQAQARVILDWHKASGINRLSGEAVDLAKKLASGGLDADSTKNLLDELGTSRSMMIDNLDSSMRGSGKYTGSNMSKYFPDPTTMDVAPTPDESALKGVIERPPLLSGSDQREMQKSQKDTIDRFADVIADPRKSDEEKQRMFAFLNKAAEASQSPAVRAYASAVVTQAGVNSAAGTSAEYPSTQSTSVARDTSYGGAAQTATTQNMIERAPIGSLAQQARVAPKGSTEWTDARREILRRADAGDAQAQRERVLLIQNGGR